MNLCWPCTGYVSSLSQISNESVLATCTRYVSSLSQISNESVLTVYWIRILFLSQTSNESVLATCTRYVSSLSQITHEFSQSCRFSAVHSILYKHYVTFTRCRFSSNLSLYYGMDPTCYTFASCWIHRNLLQVKTDSRDTFLRLWIPQKSSSGYGSYRLWIL